MIHEKAMEQALFCSDLMKRIVRDLNRAEPGYYQIPGHTVLQQDIVRLRREPMELSKILGGR